MPAPFSFNHVLIPITVKKSISAIISYNAVPCISLKNTDDKQASHWRSPILKKQWKDENLKYN